MSARRLLPFLYAISTIVSAGAARAQSFGPPFGSNFYAHIPTLDLTTHGKGLEGARAAAHDLLTLWVAEKRARGESLPRERERKSMRSCSKLARVRKRSRASGSRAECA